MDTKGNTKSLIEYALIIAMFYLTGGAFSYTNYSTKVIVFFFLTFILCLYYKKINVAFNGLTLVVTVLQFLCLLVVPFFNGEGVSSYLAIAMILWSGMFCAAIIPIEEFKRKYINVITFFAAVSLVAMLISAVYPQIALLFPKIIGSDDASVDYYNAGIHVFMQSKAVGSLALSIRNNGICWEPGCYQAFLNLGLVLLLEKQMNNEEKNFTLKFGILVATLLTTVSTTGIIIMLVILLVYFKIWIRSVAKHKSGIVSIVAIILVAYFIVKELNLFDFFTNKIQNEFNEDAGFLDRISLDKINYLFADGTFWFFGMGFERWLTFDTSLWNSIIHSFLCLGIPFTILQISLYFAGTKKLVKHHILLFLILILCFSTETLFWRVFFSTIAFYGIVDKKQAPFKTTT